MFIEIDYERQLQNAKLHLAKPNKEIIDIIPEKFNDTLLVELGGISELSFTIPYYLEDEETGEHYFNNHINTVIDKMLIRVTLGSYSEWFVIDEIDESSSDNNSYSVTAFALPYELTYRLVEEGFNHESINATEALTELLKNYAWNVGYVDPTFDEMKRSFEESETTVLDLIETIRETYGALIVWDTHNRTISLHRFEKYGQYRGLNANHGRLLQSVTKKKTTDEMVTRLHIEGSDGLTIHSVNPTGKGYIEDFSYYMYPFERDENKNVIKSSIFMSDELCHALLNNAEAIEKYSPQIKSLNTNLSDKESRLIDELSILDELQIQYEIKLELLDVAKASENQTLINEKKLESDQAGAAVVAQEIVINSLNTDIENIKTQINNLYDSIDDETGFTSELYDELNKSYIFERTWKDDRYIDVQELYDDGIKEFQKHREPKVVLEAEIDNFMNVVEEQYYWDKLVIGDRIKIKYPEMNINYMATLVKFEINMSARTISITVSNTKDLLDDMDKFEQLMSQNKSASTAVENSKYKWDKINAVENEVNAIISQEWDANKRKITAGANNSIDIGGRGIVVKNPNFPNEVIIIQSGIVALSEDYGETWKTAIKPDGIVAERLIGRIIAGQELIITNSRGSFTLDSNGFRVRGLDFVVENSTGDKNLVDEWNKTGDFVQDFRDDNIITSYEKQQLKEKWTELKIKYDFIAQILSSYYDDEGMDDPQILLLHQSYERLFNYLFVDNQTDGRPLLGSDSMDKATRIDRYVFEARFNDFRNQIPVVEEIIHRKTSDLIKRAQEDIKEARRQIDEIENDTIWKLELTSSKGVLFTNNNIQTTITATVYKGSENYTNQVPASGFIWKKYDKDGNLDVEWTNRHSGIGNVINVDEEDVFKKAIFHCDIDVNEE